MKESKTCKFVKKDGDRCKGIMLLRDGFCRLHSSIKKKKTPKKLTLSKRITMKCFGCAGTAKEVTLCHLFDCPLWANRFGYSMKSKRYAERMKKAEKYYENDIKEFAYLGVKMTDFYKEHPVSAFPGEE